MFTAEGGRIKTFKRPNVRKLTQRLDRSRHPFEDYLSRPVTRKILRKLASGPNGRTTIENVAYSYRNPHASWWHRVKYAPVHQAIDYFVRKTGTNPATLTEKVFHHRPTIRAFVNTARSIAQHGLLEPQRFSAPLMVVWNITNACNLTCKHCYQEAQHKRMPDELTLGEKLRIVDELSENYVPFLAFAGGEPLIDPDLWFVLERCQKRLIHTTVATNGTLLTPKSCERLRELGVKYVEVSLDSAHPEIHDEFRGMKGAWQRAVQGIRNVVASGMRAGVAACFTRETVDRAQEMIDLAISLGASSFVHFNFIPVGRGTEIASQDITPEQREWLIRLLHRNLQEGKIGIMSTAPQFGRACALFADPDSAVAMGHAGSGKGEQAQVLSKYMGGCGAARCYCSIQPNGIVNPCVYIPSKVMGDLRRMSFQTIWNHPLHALLSDREDRGDHCGVCDFRFFCGGCRARAESYLGDLQAGDPGCIYNRHVWEEIQTVQPEERAPIASEDASTVSASPVQ